MGVVNYDTVDGAILGDSVNGTYMRDALGSVTGTTSPSTSAVQNTYRYKPYGSQLSKTGSSPDPKFQWVGTAGYRQTSISHSANYVRARHYGQEEGRWTTVDPLWPREPAYAYVSCGPIDIIDYFGQCPEGARGWHFSGPPIQCPYNIANPPPESRYNRKYHDCFGDPCGYVFRTGQVKSSETGYVACCYGVAYACVRPGSVYDPGVLHCLLAHERDHIKRNRNCNDWGKSGCRGKSPKDRDIGGGWWDIGNNIDECLAYAEHIKCLINEMKYRKCFPKSGKTWGRRCGPLYLAVQDACELGKPYCQSAGMLDKLEGCRLLPKL